MYINTAVLLGKKKANMSKSSVAHKTMKHLSFSINMSLAEIYSIQFWHLSEGSVPTDQGAARGQQWSSREDRRTARNPGLGGKTESTVFKKTMNLQRLLNVSSVHSCLLTESMKHVNFISSSNTHEFFLCLLPGMTPRHLWRVLYLLVWTSPNLGLISSSQAFRQLQTCQPAGQGSPQPTASQLLHEELAGPWLLCTK